LDFPVTYEEDCKRDAPGQASGELELGGTASPSSWVPASAFKSLPDTQRDSAIAMKKKKNRCLMDVVLFIIQTWKQLKLT